MLGDGETPRLLPAPRAPRAGRAPCSQQAQRVQHGDGGACRSLGSCPQGTGSRFGRRRRRKAPDCQAAVQLVETAPIVVYITQHGSARSGSGDVRLHPVAHAWKPHWQRSAGWRGRGVCVLRHGAAVLPGVPSCRGGSFPPAAVGAREASGTRGLSLGPGQGPCGAPHWCQAQRGHGLCCPPCRTRHAALQGDIGGSAQGHLATVPRGSPRHGERRQPRETDGLCGAARWTG